MKIFIAGDYCPRGRVSDAFSQGNFSSVLEEVRSLTSQVEYSVINFECPVVKGQAKPIKKSGPNLSCPEYGVEALRYAGFKCVTLANNHFRDYGNEGVSDTLAALADYGIDRVGGGININEAAKILYTEANGERLAIVNCCEHEFSIANADNAGSNPLCPINQYYAILEARRNADYVLVIVHGGHEHLQYPSFRMVETYRFFIDSGADAVVNHHQHCFSGYETYHDKPIFYGLGNFCFDNVQQRTGKWCEGYAITIEFSENSPTFAIHPYTQCTDDIAVRFLPDNAFDEKIHEINDAISHPGKLERVIGVYYKKCSGSASWLFEPIRLGIYYKLRYNGWLPSFISGKRKLDVANQILCESYLDRIKWWLEN